MNTTDQMKEELLQTQHSLEFALKHLKEARNKSIQCNPFVDIVLFDMIHQLKDIQFKLDKISRSVNETEVTIKK